MNLKKITPLEEIFTLKEEIKKNKEIKAKSKRTLDNPNPQPISVKRIRLRVTMPTPTIEKENQQGQQEIKQPRASPSNSKVLQTSTIENTIENI